ncbi:MAG: tetratricopeptide repeat protein [Candidatus Moranbacteria bacterium]|nr:tetratricopeptide repeat protein [Candidatus Moranbacteria bacterium]
MIKLINYIEGLSFWKVAVILATVGLILYINTFTNQLFWDDYDSIVNNAYVKSWNYLPNYFSENLTAGSGIRDNYWRPLLLFSFSLDYKIGKLTPLFYHLQSLFWHILSAVLAYWLIFKLFKNKLASLIAALIFLAHPLQAEAVTYVAGRADPMHAALMLAAFLFFYKYVAEKAAFKFYFWSIVFFSAALLTKERAIVLPALLVLYYVTLYPEPLLQNWKKKIINILPYTGIAVLYLILRMTVLHFADVFDLGQPNNIGAQNWYEKFLAYCQGIAVYAGLLFWPAKLYMEKSISIPPSFWNSYVISGLIIVISSLAGIVYSFRRKKIFAFGMLWFWVALSPSFHIYPIQGLLYEHWLYFPMIGLLAVFVLPLATMIRYTEFNSFRIFLVALLTVGILALGIRTIVRNRDWNNPIRFYEKNVSLGGLSARVYTNLGMAYDGAGRHEEAIGTYQKAIALDNRLFQPWYDTGNAYWDMQKLDEALAAYQKSVELNPYFLPAYYNLAGIYAGCNDFDNAAGVLQKALAVDSNKSRTYYNLGIVYYQKGDKTEAKKYFTEALRLEPSNVDLLNLVNGL